MPSSSVPRVSPNTSTRQSSPLRSGTSSTPTSQAENIDPGPIVARQVTSTRPYRGVQAHRAGCSSRTVCPGRNGCCPRVLPTGPDHDPLWAAETRSGGSWSPGHHTGCSAGIVRCRPSGPVRAVAAAASRELHAGRYASVQPRSSGGVVNRSSTAVGPGGCSAAGTGSSLSARGGGVRGAARRS